MNYNAIRLLSLLFLLGAAASPAAAQSSASYRLVETSFNNAGDPVNGVTLASTHFHIKLDSVGDSTVLSGLSSASFRADGGFVSHYRPAGEVIAVRFTNPTTLQWNAEASAQWYEVYRDTTLPGTFGTCFASDLTTATVADAATPSIGSRFFYLITARNRIREEGTKGFGSSGLERPNTLPCP